MVTTTAQEGDTWPSPTVSSMFLLIRVDLLCPQRRNSATHLYLVNLVVGFSHWRGHSLQDPMFSPPPAQLQLSPCLELLLFPLKKPSLSCPTCTLAGSWAAATFWLPAPLLSKLCRACCLQLWIQRGRTGDTSQQTHLHYFLDSQRDSKVRRWISNTEEP